MANNLSQNELGEEKAGFCLFDGELAVTVAQNKTGQLNLCTT